MAKTTTLKLTKPARNRRMRCSFGATCGEKCFHSGTEHPEEPCGCCELTCKFHPAAKCEPVP